MAGVGLLEQPTGLSQINHPVLELCSCLTIINQIELSSVTGIPVQSTNELPLILLDGDNGSNLSMENVAASRPGFLNVDGF